MSGINSYFSHQSVNNHPLFIFFFLPKKNHKSINPLPVNWNVRTQKNPYYAAYLPAIIPLIQQPSSNTSLLAISTQKNLCPILLSLTPNISSRLQMSIIYSQKITVKICQTTRLSYSLFSHRVSTIEDMTFRHPNFREREKNQGRGRIGRKTEWGWNELEFGQQSYILIFFSSTFFQLTHDDERRDREERGCLYLQQKCSQLI